MSTGEVRQEDRGVHVYPRYTWLRCARFLVGWDSCPVVEYSALQGRVEDGIKYVVYRMLMYSNRLTPCIGKKRSMGGVYMLPIGMAPKNWNGAGAIRLIWLAPPGVSTNEVLAAVSDDIIEGTEKGFEMTTENGEKGFLFLDVVEYVGENPAVSHTLDLLGRCSSIVT